MPNSKSRLRLTNEQKAAVCDKYLMNLKMSQSELGKWAQGKLTLSEAVSQKTISNILANSDQIYDLVKNGKEKGKTHKSAKIPDLDKNIEKYITDMNHQNNPVNRANVLLNAKVKEPHAVVAEEESEEESEDQEVDVGRIRAELKRAYQTILYHTIYITDEDHYWMEYVKGKLKEMKAEEVSEMKQSDLRQYFSSSKS